MDNCSKKSSLEINLSRDSSYKSDTFPKFQESALTYEYNKYRGYFGLLIILSFNNFNNNSWYLENV